MKKSGKTYNEKTKKRNEKGNQLKSWNFELKLIKNQGCFLTWKPGV